MDAGGWAGAGGDVLVNSLVGMLIHTPDDSALSSTQLDPFFFFKQKIISFFN